MIALNKLIKPTDVKSLVISSLIGLGIALALIPLFLYGVSHPNPEWGDYWKLRPMIMVSLGGALGGAFYCFVNSANLRGWRKALALLLGAIGYVFALWISSILGLDGTLWN